MRRWIRRSNSYDWIADQLERRGVRDPEVLRAMRAVPRDRFVPDDVKRMFRRDRHAEEVATAEASHASDAQ